LSGRAPRLCGRALHTREYCMKPRKPFPFVLLRCALRCLAGLAMALAVLVGLAGCLPGGG